MKLIMRFWYDVSNLQLKWQLVSMDDLMKRSAPVVYKHIKSDDEAVAFKELIDKTVLAFETKYSCKCEIINFKYG